LLLHKSGTVSYITNYQNVCIKVNFLYSSIFTLPLLAKMNYKKQQLNDKTKEHFSCRAKSAEKLSTLSSLLDTAPIV